MQTSEIKSLIEQGIDGSEAIVTGDGGKYEATVISSAFEGTEHAERTSAGLCHGE